MGVPQHPDNADRFDAIAARKSPSYRKRYFHAVILERIQFVRQWDDRHSALSQKMLQTTF
jgi:hypothetical protein